MAGGTESFGSDLPRDGAGSAEWVLAVAMDCQRLDVAPQRLSLAGVSEVEIGRGEERGVQREDRRVRIELADRWISRVHARLARAGKGWVAEDAGSKNGMRVNGRPIDRVDLADGDVIECGGTFLVLRFAPGPARDLDVPGGRAAALQTLSPALERELGLLRKVASSRVPILLRGESGTGKELVANAIHELSGRTGPLVAVNCGAIPSTLVESELFGSRRGAFSGAEDRPGLVRNAEHGTLFLDEVAELPADSQAALLRVLQEHEVLPLGTGRPITVDVRVVAATNRPLEELVAGGKLRRDLYARLRGYELRLPPLQARIEDLGLLVANLLARHDPRRARRFSRTAARALFLHPWTFNIRELDQMLCAAVAVAAGPEIGVDDLSLTHGDPASGDDGRPRLIGLLAQHQGNLSAVARALGTSRTQVRRLLARHAITYGEFRR